MESATMQHQAEQAYGLRWGKCFGENRWWVSGRNGGVIYVDSEVQAKADWFVQWGRDARDHGTDPAPRFAPNALSTGGWPTDEDGYER